MKDQKFKAYLLLHFSVFLWGFTAILGDMISLSALVLVWWRVGLTAALLFLFPRILRELRNLDKQILKKLFGAGVLIALHWVCFYGAIKLANASVALVTMALTAFFTVFAESFLNKSKLSKVDLLFGIAVVPGMILINQNLEWHMQIGLLVGILGALLIAIFGVVNKKLILDASAQCITLIEMSSAFVFLSFVIPPFWILGPDSLQIVPEDRDWIYLFVLSLFCTITPFILHLRALKYVSAFSLNLIFNLEPLYGMIMAALLLKDYEELSQSFYMGGIMIILTVLIYPSRHRLFKQDLQDRNP